MTEENKQENNAEIKKNVETEKIGTSADDSIKSDPSLMRKNFVWNTIGSTLYACTSLFFMIIVTRINGVEDAGIFTFAFSFACMIQVVALFASRTYQVTERDSSIKDIDYIYFKLITCAAMIVLSILFIFLRDYESKKILVMSLLVLYKCLDAFAEVIYAIFQRRNNLYQVGISFTLKAVTTTLVLLIVDLITKDMVIACLFMLFSDIVIFLVYDLRKLKKYKIIRSSFNISLIKKLFIGGISVCIFTLLSQYLLNTQKYVIDFISTKDVQAIFGIILMPAAFIALCAQLIINPFLYQINKYLKNKEYSQFTLLIIKICTGLLVIGIGVFIICYFLGIPFLELIYGLNLKDYLIPLLFIVAGSCFFAIELILSNALIALRKNIVQIIIYALCCFIATLISCYCIDNYGIDGAGVSFFIAMLLLMIMYIIYFAYCCIKLKHIK